MSVALWLGTLAGRRLVVRLPMVHMAQGMWLLLVAAVMAAVIRIHDHQLGSRHRVRSGRLFIALTLAGIGVVGGARAWWNVSTPRVGTCSGFVTLVDDPVPAAHAQSVVVRLGHVRYRVLAHGSVATSLATMMSGESFHVAQGTCRAVAGRRRNYELQHHVLGQMNIVRIDEWRDSGNALVRASNRLRRALVRGARLMPASMAALFAGLVIGDVHAQSATMIGQFRASGLSHLCSASGQNVAFILAAMNPLLRRLMSWWRLVGVLATIGWFVVLTRSQPSVLRAAVMAAIVAVNVARGRPLNARIVVALSTMFLIVLDPMLAWNVGFALSVGATVGLAWLSSPIARVLMWTAPGRHSWWRRAVPVLAATLAAQVGTLPVTLFVFHNVPVVAVVANPLAVPVAGFVMLVGIPGALVASVLPAVFVWIIDHLMLVPTVWVAFVARTAARVGPTGLLNVVGWGLLVAMALVHLQQRTGHDVGDAPM